MITPRTPLPTRPAQPYHHGNLRHALLEAAREIVAEEGIEGLTLRACARRAGVSHAAPAHHFGSLAGLLSEFAADGYERLTAAMDAASDVPNVDELRAAGLGYIRFAMANPEHFRVMSRRDLLDLGSQRLQTAYAAVRKRVRVGLTAAYEQVNARAPDAALLAVRETVAWSSVHGYASLWVEGELRGREAIDPEVMLGQLRPALVAL